MDLNLEQDLSPRQNYQSIVDELIGVVKVRSTSLSKLVGQQEQSHQQLSSTDLKLSSTSILNSVKNGSSERREFLLKSNNSYQENNKCLSLHLSAHSRLCEPKKNVPLFQSLQNIEGLSLAQNRESRIEQHSSQKFTSKIRFLIEKHLSAEITYSSENLSESHQMTKREIPILFSSLSMDVVQQLPVQQSNNDSVRSQSIIQEIESSVLEQDSVHIHSNQDVFTIQFNLHRESEYLEQNYLMNSVDNLEDEDDLSLDLEFDNADLKAQLFEDMIESGVIRNQPQQHNQQEDCCSICYNQMEAHEKLVQYNCKHLFHHECAKNWFIQKQTCPNCRQKITNNNN